MITVSHQKNVIGDTKSWICEKDENKSGKRECFPWMIYLHWMMKKADNQCGKRNGKRI
jgi:hypothetical protein